MSSCGSWCSASNCVPGTSQLGIEFCLHLHSLRVKLLLLVLGIQPCAGYHAAKFLLVVVLACRHRRSSFWLLVLSNQLCAGHLAAELTHDSHSASNMLLGSSQQGSLFDVLACRRLRSSSYSSMGPVLLHTSSQCFSVLSWQALPCATSRCLLVRCWPQWELHSCFEGGDGAARSCCPTQLSACTIEGASP